MHVERLPVHNPGGLGIFALMAQALVAPMPPDWPSGHAEDRGRRGAARSQGSVKEPRRSLLQRLDRWFWERQQRDLERYLAQSADVHDLEARIRLIERRGLNAYY